MRWAAAVGILVGDGRLAVDASGLVPEWTDARAAITAHWGRDNGSAESIFGAAPIRSSATASIFVSRLRNARV